MLCGRLLGCVASAKGPPLCVWRCTAGAISSPVHCRQQRFMARQQQSHHARNEIACRALQTRFADNGQATICDAGFRPYLEEMLKRELLLACAPAMRLQCISCVGVRFCGRQGLGPSAEQALCVRQCIIVYGGCCRNCI